MSSASADETVAGTLAALADLDLDDLHRRWRALTGRAPPAHLPRGLLLRMYAYRVQADAWGDLDAKSIAVLRKLAQQRMRGRPAAIATALESIDLSSRGARTLAPGTVLGREHAGVMHHVMVLDPGFAWNGTTYRSLSEVAFAITGTRWNGRRFFALDKSAKPERGRR